MYKNMLIIGSDKCGKTTLASKISKKEDCNIINLDLLIKAFEETFPKEDNDNYKEFQTKFIINYVNEVTTIKNQIDGKKVVIEGQIPNLEFVIKELDQSKIAIIGITYDNISLEKFAKDIKEFASTTDMFKYLPDNLVEKKTKTFIEKNNEISKILEENDINCYDVSENRHDVFKQIIEDIDQLTSYSGTFNVKKKK